jgi:phospho-N-acetylmuramoyl-pentapeptide-transferase
MTRALVIGAAAFGVALVIGTLLIPLLQRMGMGKAISDEGPESHRVKAGTPTMGGLIVLATAALVTLPANVAGHPSVLLPLGVMGATGVIGFADDLLTIQGRERAGAHERSIMLVKAVVLLFAGLLVGFIVYYTLDIERFFMPHFGDYPLELGYVPVAVLVVGATASAAAVTDGLDGLLGGLMAFAFGAYGVIAASQGQAFLAVFCFTIVGALLGFLWHNAHPARVFMGDTGALPLGAALGTVALMTGWWLVLPVVGVVLVAELLSDFVQIGSFQVSGRRVLKMAPLHHHFELLGWAETQVVQRFWLLGMLGAMLGVALVLTQ